MSRHYIRAVAITGGPILWDYFAYMRKHAKNPDKYPFAVRYRKIRKILRIKNLTFI